MIRSPETSRWNKRPLNKPPRWRRPASPTKKRPRKQADQACRSVAAGAPGPRFAEPRNGAPWCCWCREKPARMPAEITSSRLADVGRMIAPTSRRSTRSRAPPRAGAHRRPGDHRAVGDHGAAVTEPGAIRARPLSPGPSRPDPGRAPPRGGPAPVAQKQPPLRRGRSPPGVTRRGSCSGSRGCRAAWAGPDPGPCGSGRRGCAAARARGLVARERSLKCADVTTPTRSDHVAGS